MSNSVLTSWRETTDYMFALRMFLEKNRKRSEGAALEKVHKMIQMFV